MDEQRSSEKTKLERVIMTWRNIILRFSVLVLVILATACAVKPTKEIIDINIAVASPQLVTSSPIVVIRNVRDARTFVSFDEDRSKPQLVTNGLDDPTITARTLGQFTTAGGERLWDFLLPEDGKTVEDLVREALTRAFTLAGITVVEPGEHTDEAIPVDAEIITFWSWNTGKWTFKFHFLSEIAIQGEIPPFENGETVSGSIWKVSVISGGSRSYINTITEGLEDLVQNAQSRIEKGK